MIERERWNSENMWKADSDECKCLDNIDKLIYESENITKVLKQIKDSVHYCIQKEDIKEEYEFTEIEEKLIELYKLVNEF